MTGLQSNRIAHCRVCSSLDGCPLVIVPVRCLRAVKKVESSRAVPSDTPTNACSAASALATDPRCRLQTRLHSKICGRRAYAAQHPLGRAPTLVEQPATTHTALRVVAGCSTSVVCCGHKWHSQEDQEDTVR
eukprot:5273181-Prymnesium_polylepis.1